MHRFIVIFFVAVGLLCAPTKESQAASEAECAIWLCLPGGFPSGCSAAYKAFKRRIKKRKSPLPSLSSCTTGPDGIGTKGRYEMGLEAFEECKAGYHLKQYYRSSHYTGMCFPDNCADGHYIPGKGFCQSYMAIRRSAPNYIKIWVEGKYLGQYWY